MLALPHAATLSDAAYEENHKAPVQSYCRSRFSTNAPDLWLARPKPTAPPTRSGQPCSGTPASVALVTRLSRAGHRTCTARLREVSLEVVRCRPDSPRRERPPRSTSTCRQPSRDTPCAPATSCPPQLRSRIGLVHRLHRGTQSARFAPTAPGPDRSPPWYAKSRRNDGRLACSSHSTGTKDANFSPCRERARRAPRDRPKVTTS
jgi:hypothetical protein